jgi:hypothetical protein
MEEGWRISPARPVERISHLLAIHKALEILLPDTRAADGWIRRPMPSSTGKVPMMSCAAAGDVDIYRVRQYVDAQRGG